MGEPRLRFKADDGSEFPAWEEKTFWDVFANLTNNTLSRECLNAESGQARNIHYGDVLVKYGVVVDVQRDGVPFVNPDVECKRWDCLKDGDVVIADTAEDETVGKAVEISNAGSDIVYSGLHTIACCPKEEFAPGYLGNYINSMSYHDQLRPYMQGIKVTSVSKTNIGLTHLLVPTLPEQRKISDCLSAVDAVIAAQQAEVDAWEQRKKGVMQKLFSQEVRFKADDGSDFPAWEEKVTEQLCLRMIGGGTPSTDDPSNYDGETSWISSSDLDENDIYTIRRTRFITDEAISNSATKRVKANSIVVVLRVGVGKVAISRCETCTSQDFISLEDVQGDICFIAYMLSEAMRREALQTQGTSIKGVTSKRFRSLVHMMPASIDEQRKIADCLSSMDEVIQKSKDELAKWQELKKGLLQQMFV